MKGWKRTKKILSLQENRLVNSVKNMDYSLVILDQAQEEIDQAFEYYAEISISVLQSFDQQLE